MCFGSVFPSTSKRASEVRGSGVPGQIKSLLIGGSLRCAANSVCSRLHPCWYLRMPPSLDRFSWPLPPAALRHHPGRLPGERARLHSQQVSSIPRLQLTAGQSSAKGSGGHTLLPAPACLPARLTDCTRCPAVFHPPPPRRQCCAGLQSIANMAAAIQAGYIDIGIAGGVEFFTKGGSAQSLLLDCWLVL